MVRYQPSWASRLAIVHLMQNLKTYNPLKIDEFFRTAHFLKAGKLKICRNLEVTNGLKSDFQESI